MRQRSHSRLTRSTTAAMIVVFAMLIPAGCAPAPGLEPVGLITTEAPTQPGPEESQKPIQPHPSHTYFIRPDGGSPEQCSGLKDAPYSGAGMEQDCAWDHPFRALPPEGTPRMAPGDTLIIAAGNYRMGFGAPGAESCSQDYPWDCHLSPIPSGLDSEHPTRILGAGWDQACQTPPELWGAERANMVINLSGSSNVVVGCLVINDHSGCVLDHTGGLACPREAYPFGDWAADGLYAQDSANVSLHDLNIHGLAEVGIRAGRLRDWRVENVRLAGNGWVGWEGDIEGQDANSGTMTFRRWTVEWNGCGETYPGGKPQGCWSQTAGGYGDGVGTGATGGDWIIQDSSFSHNTSDGLDLLYHQLGGRVSLDRVRAEGNAGNPVKITGAAAITNSLLVANCAFFEGQPFTYDVDPCRAFGNALEITYTGGERASLMNSTLYGQGDGLLFAGPREGHHCTGNERLEARNNIFLGDRDFSDPEGIAFLFYTQECPGLSLEADYNLYHGLKLADYNPGPHDTQADPAFNGPLSGSSIETTLTSGSPAIDAGDNANCPPEDYLREPRPVDGDGDGDPVCDLGAYERQ